MNVEEKHQLILHILNWYKKNKRDLPWRKTRDPYYILVSEVMLQQTQVSRVVDKYQSFLKKFPTISTLARARAGTVITQWQGLGYNRRALFLQKTAQAVVKEYNGEFPKDLELLKTLPGIGDYTARAILSFAFKEKVPMMDTNHRKFYSRIFTNATNDKELLVCAEELLFGLTKQEIYNWNQGLMDFMSAVARNETGDTIDWFNQRYPEQSNTVKKVKKIKKQKPFKETDRYIRGRIIDLLREEKKLSLHRTKNILNLDKEKFVHIVKGLHKDGLIKIQGKSIMLP